MGEVDDTLPVGQTRELPVRICEGYARGEDMNGLD